MDARSPFTTSHISTFHHVIRCSITLLNTGNLHADNHNANQSNRKHFHNVIYHFIITLDARNLYTNNNNAGQLNRKHFQNVICHSMIPLDAHNLQKENANQWCMKHFHHVICHSVIPLDADNLCIDSNDAAQIICAALSFHHPSLNNATGCSQPSHRQQQCRSMNTQSTFTMFSIDQ